MNGKERLHAALAGRETDVPAVAPQYLSLFLDERSHGLYEAAYAHRLGNRPGASCRIDHAEDAGLRAAAILGAYDAFAERPDWIHTEPAESHAWARAGEMEVAAGSLVYRELSGRSATLLRDATSLMLPTSLRYMNRARTSKSDLWDQSVGVKSEADVEALTPIRTAEELERDGVFEVTRILAGAVGHRVAISAIAPTPFWSTYSLLGFQGMLIMLRERPELFDYLMARRHEQRWELLRGYARAGVDCVWIEECLSSADLISPRDYQRFAFGSAQKFITDANQLGLATILYYCGDVMPRVPWLLRLGMTALAVEESKKVFAVDIGDVIRQARDTCCVFGNVDSINAVHRGTPAALAAEVGRQLELGRRARGFVLCQGSPFPLETDLSRIDHFVRLARCHSPYTYIGAKHHDQEEQSFG